MKFKILTNPKNRRAQTIIELTVFGAILMFMIGIILRQTLGFNQQQSQNLKAVRLAMTQSFEHSEGFRGGGGFYGDPSRNAAAVLFIEDRQSAGTGKYGTEIDRVPDIASGTASHTRNLFMPVDPGEDYAMPIVDVFVNGQYFPFTTAGLNSRTLIDDQLYTKIPRGDSGITDFDRNCDSCFDLHRCSLDRGGLDGCPGPIVPDEKREDFSWQWIPVSIDSIDVDEGLNTLLDLDQDLKEEIIISKSGDFVHYIDPNEGDFDLTVTNGQENSEFGLAFKPVSGLTNEAEVITRTGEGTFLEISDSPDQVINTGLKDQEDVITRVIQLGFNTGRFCDGGAPTPTVGEFGPPNPVRLCVGAIEQCLDTEVTCMALNGVGGFPTLFIRSNLQDFRGRQWITDKTGDPQLEFTVPTNP